MRMIGASGLWSAEQISKVSDGAIHIIRDGKGQDVPRQNRPGRGFPAASVRRQVRGGLAKAGEQPYSIPMNADRHEAPEGPPVPPQPPHAAAAAAATAGRRLRYDAALLVALAPVALATYYCVIYLDIPVARFIWRYLYASKAWSRYTSSLPDNLLMLVVCVTAGSAALFRHRVARRHGVDAPALGYKMLAIAAPAAFLAKSLLKLVFGRINTREWLPAPQEYVFQWFAADERHSGFPSGHMVVVTALAAVVWRFHPRCRPVCLALLLFLALALIATDYHFVSDVIAGAYAGLVVEAGAWRAAGRRIGVPPEIAT